MSHDLQEGVAEAGSRGPVGVLCALPEELGCLAGLLKADARVAGVELSSCDLAGAPLLACVAGVGKVRAAQGATALLAAGVRRALFVVGVCGGLRRSLGPGALVHCTRAVQADLALRADRECAPDPRLLEAWSSVAGGARGWLLSADRPVLSPWRRLRLGRAYRRALAVDMETAAVGAVASSAGVPWAALRAVTDGVWLGGSTAFGKYFPAHAGRAADTLPGLLELLQASGGVEKAPQNGARPREEGETCR